ncbi:helix-turn-helix transcriptional regulator [Actinoplanes couchii]|uniref:Transcriptional regulator n=1 Tax=Actinoplanes couchii TaxID=403638 RepID=A0ABQ3XMU7_9ACTN|nr:helix-turn-helix transcriptional regulator [Actinoplanes couchii]MDR6317837.1 transcriptional regulator with XRE-family HTH domain [Actinoplanes couchii]GID59824.1 transcriptional regulator [Actinoplanes couchii]
MDNRAEVSAFLKSRRGRITPDQAGVPSYGERRVPGLRRSEVAQLAGVSAEYYTRLERGNVGGVSESVLNALAGALQLDEIERAHLRHLARAAATPGSRVGRRAVVPSVRRSVLRLIEGMPGMPAYVSNNRLDVLATNALGRALMSDLYVDPASEENMARFTFLNPVARHFYLDYDRVARSTVGHFRAEAVKNPCDSGLSALIGELTARSDTFRVLWGAHDVLAFRDGSKRFRHPVVGEFTLDFEALPLPDDSGLQLAIYNAEPGSTAADALTLLARWAATTRSPADVPSVEG